MSEAEEALLAEARAFTDKFDEAMDDDFNTADAQAVLFDLVRFANSNVTGENSRAFIVEVKKVITTLGDILGRILEKKQEVLDDEIEALWNTPAHATVFFKE